jgi:outer membrane lipoprotein-sorting protein
MNCAESKELMVAYIEDLLDEKNKRSVAEHLEECASCRAELKEISNLHDRLVKNGKVLARGDIENAVLDRIIREQNVKIKAATTMSTFLKIRRIIMKSPITKLAAAAVIVIAVVVGVSQFFGGTVTFAEVVKPILNARTVVFDLVMGKDETGPVLHDVVVGSRIRRTFSNMDTVLVIDTDNAKMLTLNPKNKGAMYVDIQGPLKEQTKNFMELIRGIVTRLKDMPVEELGKNQINGRNAVGFRVCGPNEEMTIWADAAMVNPVRIEMRFGQTFVIIKNIEFDVPVDESLISMEPPADYTLSSMEYKMNQFTEQDFIESLRIWAEILRDGSFPETLTTEDYLKVTSLFREKLGQLNLSQEEGTRIGMTFGRGMLFFQQFSIGRSDWHYAGNGVKLGEAGKAVFWYQPKGAETYRVIYGDLHVEDVAPENLPK